MESRTYTVHADGEDLRCYKGFNQKMGDAAVIAVVLNEGEPSVFSVDDHTIARQEFLRFVADEQIIWSHYRLLGFFKKEDL